MLSLIKRPNDVIYECPLNKEKHLRRFSRLQVWIFSDSVESLEWTETKLLKNNLEDELPEDELLDEAILL